MIGKRRFGQRLTPAACGTRAVAMDSLFGLGRWVLLKRQLAGGGLRAWMGCSTWIPISDAALRLSPQGYHEQGDFTTAEEHTRGEQGECITPGTHACLGTASKNDGNARHGVFEPGARCTPSFKTLCIFHGLCHMHAQPCARNGACMHTCHVSARRTSWVWHAWV